MIWSLFEKKKLLGLDIGTSTIKLAELDVGRKKSSLVSFAMIPTPADAFVTGDITDTASISNAVRELVAQVKTKRNRVAVGLGGASVIVKRVTIPAMEESLISEQIRWEAEQYIPYDINEVNLGFEVIRKQGETMEILLVAAVQAHVMKYAEVTQLSQVHCDVVDVNGFALANCFRHNYGDMAGQSVAILNFGASATNMVVFESGVAVFSRDIPIGGLTYTQDLQKGLNVSLEEAESIKLSLSSEQSVQEAQSIVRSTHEAVLDEVKSSFEFYYNSTKSGHVQRIFVSGGASRTPGLIDLVSQIHTVERLNPFFNLTLNKDVFSQSYLDQIQDFAAVAIGLGLRQVGDA